MDFIGEKIEQGVAEQNMSTTPWKIQVKNLTF